MIGTKREDEEIILVQIKKHYFNMETKDKKVIVIFSGGQDSTVCLGYAQKHFGEVKALTFSYGQRHKQEVYYAKKICERMGVDQKIIDLTFFGSLSNSALTGEGNVNDKHELKPNLPASFVPNRNALFITIAHAFAQSLQYDGIVIGANMVDYSGYPDCRDSFLQKIGKALNEGSEATIDIHAPLLKLTKEQIWRAALKLGVWEVVVDLSVTCYNGKTDIMNDWGMGCGECPACKLRKKGYEEAMAKSKK